MTWGGLWPQPKGSEIAEQRLPGYRETAWAEAHPTKLQNWGSAPDPGIYRIKATGMFIRQQSHGRRQVVWMVLMLLEISQDGSDLLPKHAGGLMR